MPHENAIRIVRFTNWTDPIFDETLAARGNVRLDVLSYDAPREDTLRALAQAHVLHVTSAKDEIPAEWFVTAALLEHCPRLACVSLSGAGYDTVDVDACTRAGVLAVNQAGGNAASVAEHTMGMLLDLAHRLSESDRQLRSRRGYTREDLMGREIGGMTIGLVGIGHVGTRVAALARAFGMRVLATDPYVEPGEIERRGAVPVAFGELVAQADVVSLHCPRTAETLKMFSVPEFARMKAGALFISTARGGIHDEAALLEALRGGRLAGAGLDVWDVEPPPLDSPLLQHPSVVSTYHTAGVTREARRNIARIAAEQILALIDGQRPARLLNPSAWDARAARLQSMGQDQ